MSTSNRKTGSVDIGVQPSSAINSELANYYGNLRYMSMEIPNKDVDRLVTKISHEFVINRLLPNVLDKLEEKQLYNGWAMKIPEPFVRPIADNDYDRSVNMEQYYDDSWGGYYAQKDRNWDWSKSAMYDEPESLWKRHPDTCGPRQHNRESFTNFCHDENEY